MMGCPDELTLDLWRAGALPADEAAAIAEHVRTCPTCEAAERTAGGAEAELRAALDLDDEELVYLSRLRLASAWRAGSTSMAPVWGWIALAGVVAGFAAWLVAAPTFAWVTLIATQVGLGSLLLNAALGFVFNVGQALLDLIGNPALGLSQPLLALLALALLLWPRQLIPQRSTHS